MRDIREPDAGAAHCRRCEVGWRRRAGGRSWRPVSSAGGRPPQAA
jgi:hypothetical protein